MKVHLYIYFKRKMSLGGEGGVMDPAERIFKRMHGVFKRMVIVSVNLIAVQIKLVCSD